MKRKLTTEISTKKLNKMHKEIESLSIIIGKQQEEAKKMKLRLLALQLEITFWQNATRKALDQLLVIKVGV
ncbi:hypothetical protein KAR91_34640 [Candidatus Pacearchaeota archaeon]|nr:hypothetical protein [Candidatus Pacearchaeota archaeon]